MSYANPPRHSDRGGEQPSERNGISSSKYRQQNRRTDFPFLDGIFVRLEQDKERRCDARKECREEREDQQGQLVGGSLSSPSLLRFRVFPRRGEQRSRCVVSHVWDSPPASGSSSLLPLNLKRIITLVEVQKAGEMRGMDRAPSAISSGQDGVVDPVGSGQAEIHMVLATPTFAAR